MRVRIYQLFCIIIFALPLAANGKTVSLSSKSGDLEINGTLLDFDGRYYSIESEYGHVVLDRKLFVCSGDGCLGNFTETELLRISVLPSLNTLLVPALIDNFARLAAGTIEDNTEDNQTHYVIRRGNRELRIELQQAFDAIAVQNLIEHRSDLALITRDLTEDERDRQQRNSHQSIWPAPGSAVIALDAYVPTVSRYPGQNSFDVEDIESVGHVALHTPSDFSVFGVEVSDEITLHSKPKALLEAINAEDGAVGILPFSQMRNVQILGLAAPCSSLPPISHRLVKSRDYAWSTSIYLHITDLQLHPQAQEFIEYLSSPSAQRVIQRAGFVDLTPEVIPLSSQGQRLALSVQTGNADQLIELQNLLKTLVGASRLTTTLILEDDQRTLDARSISELVHLYRFLGSDRHDFKEVLVLGLSGASEKDALTETLDLVSEKIGKGLINASGGIKSIQTRSFTNSFPSTCDRNVSNRPHIEIWAR
jgi:phosphate transport system substrate-binding protein